MLLGIAMLASRSAQSVSCAKLISFKCWQVSSAQQKQNHCPRSPFVCFRSKDGQQELHERIWQKAVNTNRSFVLLLLSKRERGSCKDFAPRGLVFCHCSMQPSVVCVYWPRGPMDKASAYGAWDCRFESCRGQFLFLSMPNKTPIGK